MKKTPRRPWRPIALFALLVFILMGFREKLQLTTVELRREHAARILLLSDLHATLYGEDQSELISQIKDAAPDAILIAGDLFDERREKSPVFALIEGITPLAPVYFVCGNHDLQFERFDSLLHELETRGVIILHGKTELLRVGERCISISGLIDPLSISHRDLFGYRKHLEDLQPLPEADTHILLAHRPEYVRLYRQFPFDVVLCGHAHGGQARLPFIGQGLLSPGQGFFPAWSGGVYTFNELTMVVSRGLSRFASMPRFYNPPELVLVLL
jgi:predicted MPP superfamily phosphohydrolase